tara:strand:+ start:542 stop:1417 length:876 start_codon:yes stop_codon:yes gene_type:complete
MSKKLPRAFDILGNVAIVRFSKEFKLEDKNKFALNLLKKQKSIKTVLEKKGKVKGRLRKQETKYLLGEKTKEVLYKENNCVFRFNIDSTYFSPRLSNERKEIARKIKKNDNVLVMFSGVGPYSIVIAKNSKAKKVFSVEINREANKYAKLNLELNKVKDKVELIQGDIKKIAGRLKDKKTSDFSQGVEKKSPFSVSRKEREENKGCPRFDVIVMPRPQLKDSFLREAFILSKKNTRIYYYDFCEEDKINSVVEKIKFEAKKFRKKIKILNIKTAGEIAPYKIRVRIDFQVL